MTDPILGTHGRGDRGVVLRVCGVGVLVHRALSFQGYEAEALSTKMGILVKGGIFKCFGSSQHIKNKFGTGYVIEIKILSLEEAELPVKKEEYLPEGAAKKQENFGD